MDGTIFLKTVDGLHELKETAYAAEDDLQVALGKYPEVLAGPSTLESPNGPLLLLGREVPIPDGDSGNFRIDHLFIDRDAVPVLVETKRRDSTDMKRKVIGQMLEYAAHATAYWPEDHFHTLLDERAKQSDKTAQELVATVSDLSVEDFASLATANLQSGNVRLIFVSDGIPDRLARVIEFLNEQMDAEVLGVEVPQYTDGQHTAFVPRVIGKTAKAVTQKEGSPYWNRDTFLELADMRASEADVVLIKKLLAHSELQGGQLSWGKGKTAGVSGRYVVAGNETRIWEVNLGRGTEGSPPILQLFFSVPYDQSPESTELAANTLSTIPALSQAIHEAPQKEKPWHVRPIVHLSDVSKSNANTHALLEGLDQLVQESAP